ncbi:Solute carrier family 12 member 3 [Hondaea fermentalgiana]|uniref:Solute carrier family 12 member 3 n=1 Tax=Hondaea fermentalgiana TaxID=2315210 RepID=A0A2R5G919_9STRA|nr:Solute carrier family 12 member 3 [Hondaea fermentalgiana]|eukprot:GBG27552.1 Solute carrier family 12 member 3 [Hondaea fermentalgiana]
MTAAVGSPTSLMWSAEGRPTDRVADYGEGITAGGTMSRLRRGVFRKSRRKPERRFDDDEAASSGKLGMIEGVFFRVLTNLFGVILFLRLGWLTAYAGIGLAILVVLLSSSLTLVTALSLSAICTNGKVAAGGAYYLISRALGPEFGASIGVLFYVATAVSVSLYLLGFAETVVSQIGTTLVSSSWDLRLIAFFGLCFCQLVCLVGVSVVVKVEKFMLLIVIVAVVLFIIGVFIGPDQEPSLFGFVGLESGLNVGSDFPGASTADPTDLSYLNIAGLTKSTQCTVSSSDLLRSEYGNVNLGIALSVFFPAVTGILAGANISGDLKNPSSAIPTGTVMAILLGACIYILLVIIFGSSFNRVTVASATFAQNVTAADGTYELQYDCVFSGLFHDSTLIAQASVSPGFVYFGIYAASLSSGLAALLGAPRILQALAKDRLFSSFDPLAKGYGRNDEPLRAYVVTFLIATLCILTGDINSVAPLITTFFLASYAMVNYACYSAEESNSPGWRPTFRYFDKWLAFLGAIGCVSVMLFLSAITGFITFTIGLGLYKYVEVSTREGLGSASSWGPHKEAAEYNTALSSALLLEEQADPRALSNAVAASNIQSPSAGLKRRTSLRSRPSADAQHTEIELGGMQNSQREGDDLDGDFNVDVGVGADDELERELERNAQRARNGSMSAREGPRDGGDEDDDDDTLAMAAAGSQFDTTHVKNYRPQCLVLSGPPRARPALALFVAGLRKARGVTIFGDVLVGDVSDPSLVRTRNMRASVSYVSQYGIRAFNDVIIAPSFRTGCRSLMQIAGLGRRMRVNTIVLGFLDEWRTPLGERLHSSRKAGADKSGSSRSFDSRPGANVQEDSDFSPPPSVEDYVGVIGDAFDLGLGVAILRGEIDLLRSEYLTQTVQTEMDRVLSLGLASAGPRFAAQQGSYQNPNYTNASEYLDAPEHGQGSQRSLDLGGEADGGQARNEQGNGGETGASAGNARAPIVTAVGRKSAKRIDVWWFVDDGGLTIMLPHILRQASSPPWVGCHLRVMAIGATPEEARVEEAAMVKLLAKLRIPSQVSIVSMSELDTMLQNSRTRSFSSSRRPADHGSSGDPDDDDLRRDSLENVALEYDDDEGQQTRRGSAQDEQVGAASEQGGGNIQRQLFQAYHSGSSMDPNLNDATSRQHTYFKVGQLIAAYSSDALLVVVSLPVPPMSLDPDEYMKWLDLLSKDAAPPVLMSIVTKLRHGEGHGAPSSSTTDSETELSGRSAAAADADLEALQHIMSLTASLDKDLEHMIDKLEKMKLGDFQTNLDKHDPQFVSLVLGRGLKDPDAKPILINAIRYAPNDESQEEHLATQDAVEDTKSDSPKVSTSAKANDTGKASEADEVISAQAADNAGKANDIAEADEMKNNVENDKINDANKAGNGTVKAHETSEATAANEESASKVLLKETEMKIPKEEEKEENEEKEEKEEEEAPLFFAGEGAFQEMLDEVTSKEGTMKSKGFYERMASGTLGSAANQNFKTRNYKSASVGNQNGPSWKVVSNALRKAGLTFRETPGKEFCQVRECPFCHDIKGDESNMYKLNVHREHGHFNCFRCGTKGPYTKLQRLLQL